MPSAPASSTEPAISFRSWPVEWSFSQDLPVLDGLVGTVLLVPAWRHLLGIDLAYPPATFAEYAPGAHTSKPASVSSHYSPDWAWA
jgi:hypothetical protein